MLCENCKKNVATTYLKQTVNGKTNEIFLCSECAQKLGLDSGFGSFGFDMLPKFFGASNELSELRCPSCGMLFSEIGKSGRVGCDQCYETFADRLAPALNRMHGNKKHAGKIPSSFSGGRSDEVEDLRSQLQKAIDEERFEDAARLRDEIKKNDENNGKGE